MYSYDIFYVFIDKLMFFPIHSQIIVRHHTVFYHIRHQIAHLILGSMQRLLQMQGGYETKRLLLDICEVMIKWEQQRQNALQTMEATSAGAVGNAGAGGNAESIEAVRKH